MLNSHRRKIYLRAFASLRHQRSKFFNQEIRDFTLSEKTRSLGLNLRRMFDFGACRLASGHRRGFWALGVRKRLFIVEKGLVDPEGVGDSESDKKPGRHQSQWRVKDLQVARSEQSDYTC